MIQKTLNLVTGSIAIAECVRRGVSVIALHEDHKANQAGVFAQAAATLRQIYSEQRQRSASTAICPRSNEQREGYCGLLSEDRIFLGVPSVWHRAGVYCRWRQSGKFFYVRGPAWPCVVGGACSRSALDT